MARALSSLRARRPAALSLYAAARAGGAARVPRRLRPRFDGARRAADPRPAEGSGACRRIRRHDGHAPAQALPALLRRGEGGALDHAGRRGERVMELKALSEQLHEYDIVVSCTASSLPILGKGLVERALRARRRRPMFMVDLAVPRDIEPEAGELDDVFLYTVDDLAQIVSDNRDSRRSAVEQAEVIIETQVGQFMRWMQARENVPLIRALREHGEQARRQELERALRCLQRGDDPAAVLEGLSQGLTAKLLHAPTQALNEAAGDEGRVLAETLAR